jgi:cytochrome P450
MFWQLMPTTILF